MAERPAACGSRARHFCSRASHEMLSLLSGGKRGGVFRAAYLERIVRRRDDRRERLVLMQAVSYSRYVKPRVIFAKDCSAAARTESLFCLRIVSELRQTSLVDGNLHRDELSLRNELAFLLSPPLCHIHLGLPEARGPPRTS